MSQIAQELRKAAASARAFADSVGLPELRRSFREMARRWDREADECDIKEERMSDASPVGVRRVQEH